MRLLLDTHTFIWWLADPDELSAEAREAIASPRSSVIVSAASIWEMSIKRARGRLRAPQDVTQAMASEDIGELAMSAAHAELAGSLPPHHPDPFDRMLIAQAHIESLTIVTRDAAFEAYGISLLRA